MALNPPQLDGITQLSNLAKQYLDNEGQINQLDILFNGTTNWAALVTQQAIDEIPSFAQAGLTAQNVLDGLYIMKQVRAQVMTINLPALVALASLK